MNWTLWWVFVPASIVLDLTPGPAVLLVLGTALRQGVRAAVTSALGILSANIVYFALSATSLGGLLLASPRLFLAVKWCGAAYLIYLGARALTAQASMLATPGPSTEERSGAGRLWTGGFVLQMSNPKALIFFAALLPQFVEPSLPVARQIAILGVTSVAIEFCVLSGYGLVGAGASSFLQHSRYASWTNRLAGLLLIAAGAGLTFLRRG